jgi:hypothetical protein
MNALPANLANSSTRQFGERDSASTLAGCIPKNGAVLSDGVGGSRCHGGLEVVERSNSSVHKR